MTISTIKEIRIFPPLAIARLGGSDEPMHNYEVTEVDELGFRQLVPSETFVINPIDGSIAGESIPPEMSFKDNNGKIKPVAPFFELWARFDDDEDFYPLTLIELDQLNLSVEDIKWSLALSNRKMVRRTGAIDDAVNSSQSFFSHHESIEMSGRANNFKDGASISFGKVQFVKPTDEFPAIRLRFTPATGKVFGHQENAVISAERAVYDNRKGGWDNYRNDNSFNQFSPVPAARLFTAPGNIFAVDRQAYANRETINLGYLDDSCDGIIKVEIEGLDATGMARVSSSPPDFAPDSFHVRTVADELKQIVNGEKVESVTVEEVIDVIRRAVETVRLFNTEHANTAIPFWHPVAIPVFSSGAPYKSTLNAHQYLLRDLDGLDAPQDHPDREKAVIALNAVIPRLREYTETARYENNAAAQMPALMRDGSGELLAISRRQLNILKVAREQFKYVPSNQESPEDALIRIINSFQWAKPLHTTINSSSGEVLSSIFTDSDKLIDYLLTESAKGPIAITLGIEGDPLVVPDDSANSAFLKLLKFDSHPMHSPYKNYSDILTGENGIEIVEKWIDSLT